MTRSDANQRLAPAGFTLVELLVVVLILAILAAVVIPQAAGIGGVQAQSAARLVLTDLEYAQNHAIVTQTNTTVTFDPSGNSYTVSNESGTLVHPITKQAYTVDFDTQHGFGRVSIDSADFGGSPNLTFNPLGAPSADGTVDIVGGSLRYRVSVAPVTGRVRVSEIE